MGEGISFTQQGHTNWKLGEAWSGDRIIPPIGVWPLGMRGRCWRGGWVLVGEGQKLVKMGIFFRKGGAVGLRCRVVGRNFPSIN